MAPAELTACTSVLHGRRLTTWKVFAVAFAVLWALTFAAAGIGELPRLIGPRLHLRAHTVPSIGLALATWAHNMRIAGWPLLVVALGMHRARWRRRLVDAYLAISLVANSALVGAAIAAGGRRLVPYLVHLPFEWAAIALSTAGWIVATRTGMPRRQLAKLAGLFAALLALAALLETYAVPHL